MTVNLSALGGAGQQFFDNNGNVLTGGKLWSYQAGTTTPQVTYTSASGATAHTNPIVLDSAGRVATGEIWVTAGQNYKFVLMTSTNVTIATWDNITGINGTGLATNAINVEYDPPFTGAVSTNVEAELAQTVSVKNFGAVGDGTTDDSAAFAAAISYANSVAFAAVSTGYPIGKAKVVVPAGDYVINTGSSIANWQCEIVGDGREVTRIKIASGQYFLTVSATIFNASIQGISFTGGKGTLAHTFTGVNVKGHLDIYKNNFNNYTECAVGSLASDYPYWKIHDNLFYGTLTSKGVVLSGNPDLCVIENNSFLCNLYHVKVKQGQNTKIQRNDFIRFIAGGGSPLLTDIWLVPNPTSVNAGSGFICTDNKFGNENLDVNDFRVLFADEGSGTNAFDKNHSTSASTGYVIGPVFNNYVAGVSGQNKGFIFTYTENVRSMYVKNTWVTVYPYVIQYSSVSVSNDRLLDSNVIDSSQVLDASEKQYGQVSSSATVAYANDPMSLYAGRTDFMQSQRADFDPGLEDLWTTITAGINEFTLTNATRIAATDSTSDADAGTFTFSSSSGVAYGYATNPENGRMAWAEIEVKAAAAQSLTQLDIRMQCNNGEILMKRVITVPSFWQRVRLPFLARSLVSPVSLQIRPVAADFSTGVRDQVLVGRARVYQSAEPVDFGARYLQALKTFDWPSIASGSSSTTTVTVVNAAFGDFVEASMSVSIAGLTMTAYVSAPDTVTVVAANNTGGAIDLASAVLRVRVQKSVSFAI